jgi:hypothetical protein
MAQWNSQFIHSIEKAQTQSGIRVLTTAAGPLTVLTQRARVSADHS